MRYLTPRQLARRLGTSARALAEWAASGEFPAPIVLPGGLLRWELGEVRAWLEARPRYRGELGTLAGEILQALEEAGDWLLGAELARRIGGDVDHTNGTFRRAIEELKQARRIKSDKSRGYCLAG